MNLLLEIADAIFLIGFVYVCVTTNKRKAGTWWRVGLFGLVVGGGVGYLLSRVAPVFDADFFPLGLTFVGSVIARAYVLRKK